MSLRLAVSCDGHRRGNSCRASRSVGLAYSEDEHWSVNGEVARAAATLDDGQWRRLPNGGDLCPSGGHDEEGEPWASQGPVPPPPL